MSTMRDKSLFIGSWTNCRRCEGLASQMLVIFWHRTLFRVEIKLLIRPRRSSITGFCGRRNSGRVSNKGKLRSIMRVALKVGYLEYGKNIFQGFVTSVVRRNDSRKVVLLYLEKNSRLLTGSWIMNASVRYLAYFCKDVSVGTPTLGYHSGRMKASVRWLLSLSC